MKSLVATLALAVLSCAQAAAHPGWGIVVDSKGNVFYTDLKQVWKIEPSGKKSVAVADVHTHELRLDAQDNLYGEHLWYQAEGEKWWHRVWKLAPDGKLTEVVATRELKAADFSGQVRDFSFVADRAGNVFWVRDQVTVMRRATDGTITAIAGGSASAPGSMSSNEGFTRLDRMAIGPDGALYLLDGGRLCRVAADGAVTTLARGLDERSVSMFEVSPQHRLMGLGVDAEGNVYVANYSARQVKKVGTDGKVTVFLRAHLPWSPTGVAVSDAIVYVLEYTVRSARVRKVPPNGPVVTLP